MGVVLVFFGELVRGSELVFVISGFHIQARGC